ncbi:hypothetical protein V500_11196 [Pseudogymnoascus sp. VKM F-4518 (FW-2643)]|nr:hypothetical protein V500_11196 [Pseudogymnoascus sp. VKM F-4518 (FW-2643)]
MKSFSLVTALLGVASGHTIMQAVVGYSQGVGIYMPSDDSPQMDVGSNSMACNGSPISGFSNPTQKITMAAGKSYTGAWLHTLTSTGADSTSDNKVIDSSHKGPVMAYMKKVSNSLSGNPSSGPGDGWFKISEDAYSNGKWGVDNLISAGGIQSFTIVMECISVTVTGGTGSKTPSTVSIPGTYGVNDPGIKVNIYNDQGQPYPSSYTPPGAFSVFQLGTARLCSLAKYCCISSLFDALGISSDEALEGGNMLRSVNILGRTKGNGKLLCAVRAVAARFAGREIIQARLRDAEEAFPLFAEVLAEVLHLGGRDGTGHHVIPELVARGPDVPCSAVRNAEEEKRLEAQHDQKPDATAAGPVGLLGPGGAAGTGVGRAGISGEWGVFLSAHLGVMSTLRIMDCAFWERPRREILLEC